MRSPLCKTVGCTSIKRPGHAYCNFHFNERENERRRQARIMSDGAMLLLREPLPSLLPTSLSLSLLQPLSLLLSLPPSLPLHCRCSYCCPLSWPLPLLPFTPFHTISPRFTPFHRFHITLLFTLLFSHHITLFTSLFSHRSFHIALFTLLFSHRSFHITLFTLLF
jgi:hypothetical protein